MHLGYCTVSTAYDSLIYQDILLAAHHLCSRFSSNPEYWKQMMRRTRHKRQWSVSSWCQATLQKHHMLICFTEKSHKNNKSIHALNTNRSHCWMVSNLASLSGHRVYPHLRHRLPQVSCVFPQSLKWFDYYLQTGHNYFLQHLFQKMEYSRTSLIQTLVIHIANYLDQLGPSGKSAEKSIKLTCLEITSNWIKYSTVLPLLELQIMHDRKVHTVNSKSQTSNCKYSLYSKKVQSSGFFAYLEG